VKIAATLLALLLFLGMRWRHRAGRDDEGRDSVDTVVGWPPEAARVLSVDERQAYDVLRRAFPRHLVLAQVPPHQGRLFDTREINLFRAGRA